MNDIQQFQVRWDISLNAQPIIDNYEKLLQQVPETTIFNSIQWLLTSKDYLLDTGKQLKILTVWNNEELVCCVPLVLANETVYGITSRVLRLLGDPLADRTPLLIKPDPGLFEFVLDSIHKCPDIWDILIFSEQPDNAILRKRLDRWAKPAGYSTLWRVSAHVPVMDISMDLNEQLWSKSLRTRLHRSRKRIDKAGNMVIKRYQVKTEQVDNLLDKIILIENASWKGQQGVGIFSTAKRFKFFKALSHAFASSGWLDISLLELDGKLISYRYGFRYKDVFLDYNLAYLPDFGKLGPGRVLLEEVIRGSLDAGLHTVDASRSSLKTGHMLSEWPCSQLDHYRLWMFAPTFRGYLASFLGKKIRPLIVYLKNKYKRLSENK